MPRQVVPGNGDVEEGGVKVNLFRKRKAVGLKGAGRSLLCLQKKITKKYTNTHHIYFQSASVIYCLGFR